MLDATRSAGAARTREPEPTRPQLRSAAATFALLASPARLHLAWLMAHEPSDVGTLAQRAGLSIPTTSQHLAKLRLAKVISARREGRHTCYTVDDPHVLAMIDQIVSHIAPDGTLAPDSQAPASSGRSRRLAAVRPGEPASVTTMADGTRREELRKLTGPGAQPVDVLATAKYGWLLLPEAGHSAAERAEASSRSPTGCSSPYTWAVVVATATVMVVATGHCIPARCCQRCGSGLNGCCVASARHAAARCGTVGSLGAGQRPSAPGWLC